MKRSRSNRSGSVVPGHFRRFDVWVPLLFIFAGFLIYSNSFQVSFRFDDSTFIADKMQIRDIGRVWREGETLRKIPYLTFALNYLWTGQKVWSWHLVNLLFHLATTLLVWSLSRVSWRSPVLAGHPWKDHAEGLSLLTGLLFLCHPVQTSAVTYIYQRTIVIATLFHVLSLYAYAKARIDRKFWMFGLAAITTVLAYFTKQVNISLPLTLLLYEAVFCASSFKQFLSRWPRFLIFIGAPVAAFFLIFRFGWIQVFFTRGLKGLYPENVNSYLTWTQWIATQFNVLRTYFRLMVFPMDQAMDYEYPIANGFTEPGVLISLLLLTALLAAGVWCWRRYRLVSFGLFFTVITLAPEFFAIRDTIFEHRMYLPMVGFAFLAPSAVQALFSNFKKTRIVCSALILALSIATFARNAVWADEEKFWLEDLRHSPTSGRSYYSLGVYYAMHGQHDKAVPQYVRAIQLWPNFADAYSNLGKSLEETGHMKDAIFYYAKAVEIAPTLPAALNNLGSALVREGRYEDARKAYREAIHHKPDNYETLNNMGSSYAKEEKYDEAYEWYLQAAKTNPEYADAQNNLGSVLGRRGDTAGAEAHYKEAVRLKPEYFEPHLNLAVLYLGQKRYDDALREYKKASSIQPDNSQINNNAATLLAREGSYAEAERYYLRAIKSKPDFTDALVSLANVYLKLSRFSDAQRSADEALRLEPGKKGALEIQRLIHEQQQKPASVRHA